MSYNMYIAGMLATEVLDDRKREATKQRLWAQAMRAKRNQPKTNS